MPAGEQEQGQSADDLDHPSELRRIADQSARSHRRPARAVDQGHGDEGEAAQDHQRRRDLGRAGPEIEAQAVGQAGAAPRASDAAR